MCLMFKKYFDPYFLAVEKFDGRTRAMAMLCVVAACNAQSGGDSLIYIKFSVYEIMYYLHFVIKTFIQG